MCIRDRNLVMLTEDYFKDFKAGDKIQIRPGPDKGSIRWVYFQSVYAGRLNYEDFNFRQHSVEISTLTSPLMP